MKAVPVWHVASLQNGFPFDSADFVPSGPTPLVRIRDLSSSTFETHLPFDVPDHMSVSTGDLVIGMDGDFTAKIWHRGRAALNQRLCRLRARGDHDIRFVAYALPAALERVHATQFATTVKHLSSEEILKSRIPSTSPNAQRRIADFLDDRVARIDQIITTRREQERLVDESFAAQRRGAVLGRGPHSSATGLPWAELVSADRSARRLSQVARMGTGHTPSRSEPSYWVDCDIPWLTTSDVHWFRHDEIDRVEDTAVRISALGLANSAAVLHPAGTVALSRTASAGFSIVMDQAMATSQDFVTWTCGPELRPDFLLHTLRVMRPFLLGNLATGSTHKTIYFPDLMDLHVLVPSVEAQDEAVRCVQVAAARRNKVLAALRRQNHLLQEYKHSLITAAVTGELDVTTAGSGVPG